MGPNTVAAITGAIRLIMEATEAIRKINEITGGETRDLTNEELASLHAGVQNAYDSFQQVLKDRGIK